MHLMKGEVPYSMWSTRRLILLLLVILECLPTTAELVILKKNENKQLDDVHREFTVGADLPPIILTWPHVQPPEGWSTLTGNPDALKINDHPPWHRPSTLSLSAKSPLILRRQSEVAQMSKLLLHNSGEDSDGKMPLVSDQEPDVAISELKTGTDLPPSLLTWPHIQPPEGWLTSTGNSFDVATRVIDDIGILTKTDITSPPSTENLLILRRNTGSSFKSEITKMSKLLMNYSGRESNDKKAAVISDHNPAVANNELKTDLPPILLTWPQVQPPEGWSTARGNPSDVGPLLTKTDLTSPPSTGNLLILQRNTGSSSKSEVAEMSKLLMNYSGRESNDKQALVVSDHNAAVAINELNTDLPPILLTWPQIQPPEGW